MCSNPKPGHFRVATSPNVTHFIHTQTFSESWSQNIPSVAHEFLFQIQEVVEKTQHQNFLNPPPKKNYCTPILG